MGLKNPIGQALREYHHYLDTPETAARIAQLERDLELERSKKPAVEVKEVVKEVVKEDLDLLNRYNSAMRELGAIKMDIAKNGAHRMALDATSVVMAQSAPKPEIQIKEIQVEKRSEIVHIKRELNKRLLAAAVAASLGIGASCGALLHKVLAPRDIPLVQKMVEEPGVGSRGPLFNVRP